MNLRHPGICLERTVQTLKSFQTCKSVCELVLEPGTSTIQSRSATNLTIRFGLTSIWLKMIFAVLFEQLICTKPTMPFTDGNVLHCCFHYRMFEYNSFLLYSVHMKRNLLSTCDMYLFQILPLIEFTVFSSRERFRLYIPLSACNIKCERENNF